MSPFDAQPKLIFHGTYHKMGTIWIQRILEQVAEEFGLQLQKSKRKTDLIDPDTNIFYSIHSHYELEELGDFVGSHMVRDPRDSIVSGYFYHLWTNEVWAHEPQDEYGGATYQEHLKSLNQDEGITEEIYRFIKYAQSFDLADWNYTNPQIFEIKYEELIANESITFEKIFRHYGFHDKAVKRSVEIARQNSFQNISGRKIGEATSNSHLRSGKPGQWQDVFSANHRKLIETELGDLLAHMGYQN